MVRPRLFRRVLIDPNVTYFKPRGIPLSELEEVVILVEEYEAVRLKDLEELDQEECARRMNISQPTFHRLILSARKKIADAIIKGKAIKIKGGKFQMAKPIGGRFNAPVSGGSGRMGGPLAAGPGGNCKCPKEKRLILK